MGLSGEAHPCTAVAVSVCVGERFLNGAVDGDRSGVAHRHVVAGGVEGDAEAGPFGRLDEGGEIGQCGRWSRGGRS